MPPKDRREVTAVLMRGEVTDAQGVEAALRLALEDEGGFVPPLVLVSGELEMQFDELEVLKATIAAMQPLASGDPKLKEALDRIQELFKTPFAQGSNGVLGDLTSQLRELCAQGHKAQVPQVDSHVERALLDAQWNARVARTLINIMAFVAILLAAIGLYGVTTHAVLQRRREIGIRLALGARGRIIATSVARRAALQLALGMAAGVAITWGFERIAGLGGDAFGFRLSDPLTLAGAATLLAVLSALGSAGPVYRASRLQPLQVLRSD